MYSVLSPNRRIIYCANCGEEGHIVRECTNPLTSFGLITFKIVESAEDEMDDLNEELREIIDSVHKPMVEIKYPRIKFLDDTKEGYDGLH